jgi:hypothetical protein
MTLPGGQVGTLSNVPAVDYGKQGGLGDIAFLPGEASSTLSGREIYLTWAEAGEGDTRGAAMRRGMLMCESALACRVEGLEVISRQQPRRTVATTIRTGSPSRLTGSTCSLLPAIATSRSRREISRRTLARCCGSTSTARRPLAIPLPIAEG